MIHWRVFSSDAGLAFPEKYYVDNFPENFRKFSRAEKYLAYFYILQYYIHIYILNIFNI